MEVLAHSSQAGRWAGRLALGLVFAAALTLRLWSIHTVPGNSFYDAAVRSMGGSLHDFFFGAIEPGGAISIDKPPVDLWLQVAATKTLGFGLFGLHLPEALGGSAACALLLRALRKPFGLPVALLGALALAVTPVAVLTSRSDTMDSVMAALLVAAMWSGWLALRDHRTRFSALSGALVGVAFNVKLTEALIILPALFLMWAWAAPPARRLVALCAPIATLVVVSLSWAAIASLTPASSRPIPIGSHGGSIWRMIFLYNGVNRFNGHGAVGTLSSSSVGAPGPLRLLFGGHSSYGALIGFQLLGVLALGALALGAHARRLHRMPAKDPRARFAIALSVWFGCGLLLFSFMRRLEIRYLEAFTPALCALLALSVGVLVGEHGRAVNLALAGAVIGLGGYLLSLHPGSAETIISLVALATALVCALYRALARAPGKRANRPLGICLAVGLLAAPVGSDLRLIDSRRSDSVLNDPTTRAMSRYLIAHRAGARFEVASANVYDVVGLVSRDALAVIVLNDLDGELERTATLARQVARDEVRFYYASHGCHTGRHCPGNERWAYQHSVPLAGYPGLRRFS
ncbi:MAG TPA: glycosyltransferase family 39 protein [Solirubrobacteraceae bacterium]